MEKVLHLLSELSCFYLLSISQLNLSVLSEAEQEVAPGSEVIDSVSEKKVGTITTQLGSRGLGVLRLDEAFKGSNTLTIQGQKDIKVEAIRPHWWPAEWLQEPQHQSAAV